MFEYSSNVERERGGAHSVGCALLAGGEEQRSTAGRQNLTSEVQPSELKPSEVQPSAKDTLQSSFALPLGGGDDAGRDPGNDTDAELDLLRRLLGEHKG